MKALLIAGLMLAGLLGSAAVPAAATPLVPPARDTGGSGGGTIVLGVEATPQGTPVLGVEETPEGTSVRIVVFPPCLPPCFMP
jgi:hypothetical protein